MNRLVQTVIFLHFFSVKSDTKSTLLRYLYTKKDYPSTFQIVTFNDIL